MKNNEKLLNIIEASLYLLGVSVLSIFDSGILLYISFFYTFFIELIKFRKTKEIICIIKIILASIIIPNNYVIIFATALLYLLGIKNIKKINKNAVLLLVLLVLNFILNGSNFINIFFGLFYLIPIFIIFSLLETYKKEISNCHEKLVVVIKKIIKLEIISIILYFIANFNVIAAGGNANDWVTGSFGFQQGNIFLFFMLFSLIVLKKDYELTKNKRNLIYIILSICVALMTNSIALIIFFIFSYFLISLWKSNMKEKIKNICLLAVAVILFLIFTPEWIQGYIMKLTNYDYFVKTVAKVQVYEDTFVNIPNEDLKFFLIGNGMGEYSSRAALTCTGEYIEIYNKMFPISISDYTSTYILPRYIKYNIIEGQGTLYSPFSTIITMQGEYGIIGTIAFLTLILILIKNANKDAKIFILFFFLSCFIENYLEFGKIMALVFMIYFLYPKNKNIVNG